MIEDKFVILVADTLTAFEWIESLTFRAERPAFNRFDASTEFTAEFESWSALKLALSSWDVGFVATEWTQVVAIINEIVLSL